MTTTETKPDWIVHRYALTKEAEAQGVGRVHYSYWVTGLNECDGETFFWQVPDLFTNPRYDMSNAQLVHRDQLMS